MREILRERLNQLTETVHQFIFYDWHILLNILEAHMQHLELAYKMGIQFDKMFVLPHVHLK